jgi:hypothetical protein
MIQWVGGYYAMYVRGAYVRGVGNQAYVAPCASGPGPWAPINAATKGNRPMSPHKNRGCRSVRNYQRMGPVWYPMLSPMGPTLGPIWCPMVVRYHKRRNSVRFVELSRYVNIRNMPNPFKSFLYIYIYICMLLQSARARSSHIGFELHFLDGVWNFKWHHNTGPSMESKNRGTDVCLPWLAVGRLGPVPRVRIGRDAVHRTLNQSKAIGEANHGNAKQGKATHRKATQGKARQEWTSPSCLLAWALCQELPDPVGCWG